MWPATQNQLNSVKIELSEQLWHFKLKKKNTIND